VINYLEYFYEIDYEDEDLVEMVCTNQPFQITREQLEETKKEAWRKIMVEEEE
jgi:hypothetical protein